MQSLLNTLFEFSYICLMAVFLYFMYSLTRSFYLVLASYFSIGGYILYYLHNMLGISYLFVGIFAGGIAASMLAIANEKFLFKPFYEKNSSSLVLLMVYLSAFLLLANLFGLIFGNDMKFLKISSQVLPVGGANITVSQLILTLFSLSFTALMVIMYKFSDMGLRLRALGQDNELAQVFGINVYKFRYIFACISGFSLGVAGAIYTWDIGMEPYLSFTILLYAMVAFIVGGVNSLLGTVVGSFMIAFLKNLLSLFLPIYFVDVVVYSILFITLIFRPEGLFGIKVRAEGL